MAFSQYTPEFLRNAMLTRVVDTVDKREGSIIYDTTAPVAEELSAYYTNLTEAQKQAYAQTATGAFLDLIVQEVGLSRLLATKAIKRADFADANENPVVVPLGNRLSTISTSSPINYTALSVYTDINDVVVPGAYLLQCEETGTIGNGYAGNLLPIDFIPDLSTVVMSTLTTPARDEETDAELKVRYFDKVNLKAFGGNIADYKEKIGGIAGVGGVQIYPTWNGGGTVLCSIVDTDFNPATTEFIDQVQNEIDPLAINATPTTGMGLGTAPIGHKVTITTATLSSVTVEATVTLLSGYTSGQVKPLIDTAIDSYFTTLKENWDVGNQLNIYSLVIYLSKILATIINVNGVANVTNVELNGSASDLTLTQTSATQEVPALGATTITFV